MGVRADYCTPAYPSKTAPGHTAMMTGAYGDVNGITANAVPLLPRSEHTLLESQSGFDFPALRAESLWLPAAKAGKRVASLSFPHAGPPDQRRSESEGAGIPPDRFVSAGSFGDLIEPDRIWDGADLWPADGWDSLPKHTGAAREFSL